MTQNDLKKYLLKSGKATLYDDNGMFKAVFLGFIGVGETPDQAFDNLCNKICMIVKAIDRIDQSLELDNDVNVHKTNEEPS